MIYDESISLGLETILVVLLVRVEDTWSRITPLTLKDVHFLHVQSAKSWNGDEIEAIISEKVKRMGIEITQVVSDKGSNLIKCTNLMNLLFAEDCTHYMANLTKKLFESDEKLIDFLKGLNLTRSKWVVSKYALYLPPAFRGKSRYHQFLSIYKWAEKILKIWDTLCEVVQKELSYLKENPEMVQTMKQIHFIISKFSVLFKGRGVSEGTKKIWTETCEAAYKKEFGPLEESNEKVQIFMKSMNDYIDNLLKRFPKGSQIYCCSDIIESIFGKYKLKPVDMITDDIACIAAYNQSITLKDIEEAMKEVSTADMLKWKQENTNISILAQKRKLSRKMAA
jgi:hypothetical protein